MIENILDKSNTENLTLEQIKSEIHTEDNNNSKILMQYLYRFIIPAIILFFITCFLLYLILIETQKHINNLKYQVLTMNEGSMDLSKRIHIISFDDIGIMTSGINGIIDKLSLTFNQIKKSTAEVFVSSGKTQKAVSLSMIKADDVNGLINALDDSSSRQVEVINGTVGSIDRMVLKIEQSIKSIDAQSQAVLKTSSAIRQMVGSFNEIQDKTSESTSLFKKLAGAIEKGDIEIRKSLEATKEINISTGKVSNIVKIIADISDKSNILAMNAAIEASHAGEFGKGFAIVASEVRLLSESTSESARNIEGLNFEMQKKNSIGIEISENLKLILQDINEGMKNTGNVINLIADSSRKQAEISIENIRNMDNLIELTKSLKTETDGMKGENSEMRNSIQKLEDSSSKLLEVNRKLSESMRSIIDNLNNVNTNFDNSFQNTHKLEELVASYKLE